MLREPTSSASSSSPQPSRGQATTAPWLSAVAPRGQRQTPRARGAQASTRPACFTTDAQGVIRTWSVEAERLLGYAAGEVVGRSGACLLGTGTTARQRLLREHAAARREGGVERVSWRVCQDGRRLRLRVRLTPLTDSVGMVDGYLHVLEPLAETTRSGVRPRPLAMADVSEADSHETADVLPMPRRRSAPRTMGGAVSLAREDWAQRRSAVLARVGEVLAKWGEDAHLPTFLARALAPGLAEWCIIGLAQSGGGMRYVGSAPGEVLAPVFAALPTTLPESEVPLLPGIVSRVLRSGRTVRVDRLTRADLRRDAHDEVRVRQLVALGISSVVCVPLKARGEVQGCILLLGRGSRRFGTRDVALVEDVARLYAFALGHQRLAAELARVEHQRDAFLSLASHELKTPLTSIKLLAQMTARQLVRMGLTMPPEASHMEHAIARMERLVNDLLDSSRAGEERLALCREVCDLGALCRERVAEVGAATDREITLALPEGSVVVLADPERLGQVLVNLLVNAAKYSPPGCPIAVRMTARDGEARVDVADQGTGIAADALDHLFERFYRVPGIEVQAGSRVGFGLGLYLCREILTRHGGRVWVESAPGQGSTFSFALPLWGEAEDTSAAE